MNNENNNLESNNIETNINVVPNTQPYQQPVNVTTPNNIFPTGNNISNTNISTDYYQGPKKKSNASLIFIIIFVLCVSGYFLFFNENENNPSSYVYDSKVKEELVGTWKATEPTAPSSEGYYYIPNVTLVLNNDNTFTVDGEYKLMYPDNHGGSTLVSHSYGKYVFNKKENKIKLIYDIHDIMALFEEFSEFEIKDDKLNIGNIIKYDRISSNNTNNTSTSTNDIVGKWYMYSNNTKDQSTYFVFNKDGTGNYTVGDIPMNLTYEINGDSLFITMSGVKSSKENHYSISNNILSIDDGVGTTTYIK